MRIRTAVCTLAAAVAALVLAGCASSNTGMSAADTSSAPVASTLVTDSATAAAVIVPVASPSSAAASPTRTYTTHTAVPVTRRTTTAPQPARTTAKAQPQGCYPRTSGGNCYKPGEYCPKADHGTSGIDGSGDAIECVDNNGWRWERV